PAGRSATLVVEARREHRRRPGASAPPGRPDGARGQPADLHPGNPDPRDRTRRLRRGRRGALPPPAHPPPTPPRPAPPPAPRGRPPPGPVHRRLRRGPPPAAPRHRRGPGAAGPAGPHPRTAPAALGRGTGAGAAGGDRRDRLPPPGGLPPHDGDPRRRRV